MEFIVIVKAFVVWLLILLLAIINGGLREVVLIPKLGKKPAMLLSGVLLSVLILAVTYLALPWLNVQQSNNLIWIGCGWLVMTLIFEFSFGLLRGMSLATILEAYTFKDGNTWSLVLIVIVLAPWLMTWFNAWLAT